MLDAIVAMQMQELSIFTVGKIPQRRTKQPHGHVYIRAPYGVMRTRDDSYIILSFASLASLGEALQISDFSEMDDARDTYLQRDLIFEKTQQAILTWDAASLLERFEQFGIWAGPVYGYQDLVDDPQVKHNGSFVEYFHPTEGIVKTPGFPIRFSETPSRVNRGAPLEGQHTREILLEAGFECGVIQGLLDRKTVAETSVEDTGDSGGASAMRQK
jgi:crotonobetainyl-CoA:carnitine CoA-transferase CaiB-like acyl-CoA transferase